MIGAGDKPRWGLSLAVVLAVHAAGVAGMLAWATPAAVPLPPPAAILIDLAPLSPAASVQPVEEPPPPEPPRPQPQPEPPDAVPLPKPPPPKKKMMSRPQPQPVAQQAVVESAAPIETPTPVAAPRSPVAEPSPAIPAWQQALLAHLERHRRYPAAARQRRQEGISLVLFSIDRQGRVVTSRLQNSSGHPLLDQESLELLRRAQPLPPPPAEVAGDRVELSVPVRFSLR